MFIRRHFRSVFRAACAALLALGALSLAWGAQVRQDDPDEDARAFVRVAGISGAIGPATARHVSGVIDEAAEDGAAAAVFQMDTPGGLDAAMRDINSAILASDVPVLVHVAPEGARATSAGVYIAYAAHVTAMAPGTSIGAATPVSLGGGGPAPEPEPDENPEPGEDETGAADDDGSEASDGETGAQDGEDGEEAEPETARSAPAAGDAQAMRNKVVNDAVAYVRSLAELRGRNADWAERAVREGVSLTATGAVEAGAADFIAGDLQHLFSQASGRTAELSGGREVELELTGARIERVEMGFAAEFLSVVTDPNIALLLMNLGFLGILVSFYQGLEPVTFIAGLICLIIGLYALNTLPLNYAGAALILLGFGLLIAEIFIASYGLLALGGLIAFAVGALMLVDSDVPGLRIDWWMVAGATGLLGLGVFAAAGWGLAAQRRRVTTGRESLVGAPGRVLDWSGTVGHVHTQGERWQARGAEGLTPDQEIEVTAMDGLVLTVAPKAPQQGSDETEMGHG